MFMVSLPGFAHNLYHYLGFKISKMMVWFLWLCLLLLLFPCPLHSLSPSPSASTHHPSSPRCHPHEASALLHFRDSFPVLNYTSFICRSLPRGGIANPNSTMSWDTGKDCCAWSGVTCDEMTGHVIRLDLKCAGLQGVIHRNSSLFLLTRLQSLVLSHNDFYGSKLSPRFGRLVSMVHLDLSSSYFVGRVPLEFSYLSNLVTLDLGLNNDLRLDTFSLKRIIANLTSLKELSLSYVDMSYVSPNSLMNLSTLLTALDLSESGLEGEFPQNVFQLPNLQELKLSYNDNLTGSFPKYNWTSPLRALSLSSTKFLIDLPFLTRNLRYLNLLEVSNCNFRGSFPALLGNITQITSLDLSSNHFGGQVPWHSFNLEQLHFLDLSANNFEGQFPEICRNSSRNTFLCNSINHDQLVGPLPLNLKHLCLFGNLFNGTIPSWLYSLPSLEYLDLTHNQFTGHIGEFQYNSLVFLCFSSNKLQGLIPGSIFQQVNLMVLDLSSNNLSGVVQLEQFSKLKNLQSLYLSSNSLSMDSINHNISALPNTLLNLHLSSCNITRFPHSLRSLENLEDLDLSNNRIEGSFPQWLTNVGKNSLMLLNISHNMLQGHLPIPPPSVYIFSIASNRFVGEIPSLFCNLSEIGVLDFSNNSLSGNIPPCFGNSNTGLFVLDLRMNRFHGMIPQAFKKGSSLSTLNLNGNDLEGPLPRSLANCEKLKFLDVGNNKLNGSFPSWLESLPGLQVLILRANRFSGPINNPNVRFPFQKLRIVDLSNNKFTGLLPAKYFENFVAMMDAHAGSLEYMNYTTESRDYYEDSALVSMKGLDINLVKIQTMFITIDFSRNYFTGEIPKLIGKLNSLKGLNFSHNKLTGLVPTSLGNLSNLEWLDLSSNELSGKIPLQLAAGMNQLEILNLSNNKLEGPIPQGKQFDTFNNDSYIGNLGLCGLPLSKSCTNQEEQDDQGDVDDEEHDSGLIDWKVAKMGYGSGLVIGVSIGYMVLFSRGFDFWLPKRFGGRRNCKASSHFTSERGSI